MLDLAISMNHRHGAAVPDRHWLRRILSDLTSLTWECTVAEAGKLGESSRWDLQPKPKMDALTLAWLTGPPAEGGTPGRGIKPHFTGFGGLWGPIARL